MKINTQSLLFFSLGDLVTSTESTGYLRRRTKASKQSDIATPQLEPQFQSVKPLLVEDAIQLIPSSDTPISSGITLSSTSLSASDSIDVSFSILPEYYVNNEVSPNATRVDEYTVGIYMHMSDPQGGALPPIVSLKPEFDRDSTTSGSITFSVNVVSEMEGTDPSWPLDTLAYGNGFDVWVLDEDGAAVIGPEWFTLETPEVSNFADNVVHHPLAGHGHADSKQDFEEEVQEVVSTFVLSTDKMYYGVDDKIQVSYTIGEVPTPTVDEDSFILFNAPIVEEEMPAMLAEDTMEGEPSLFDASSSESTSAFDADFSPQQVAAEEPSYSIGIYMKMARPQKGKLDPIASIQVDTKSGSVSFDASALDTLVYGTGFDVWIIDEEGSEVYGPVFFSIPDPNEEVPVLTGY